MLSELFPNFRRLWRHTFSNEVADKTFACRQVFAFGHDSLLDAINYFHLGLDITEFHADTTNFNLKVDTSEAFEFAATIPAGEVTGSVNALLADIWNLDLLKSFSCQLWLIAISACQSITTDPEFSGKPSRNGLVICVKNVDFGIGNRAPDRNRFFAFLDLLNSRPDCRLCRTVEVPEFVGGIDERIGESATERFSTTEDAKTAISFPTTVEQHLPRCRCRLHHADVFLVDEVGKTASIFDIVATRDHNLGSGEQRKEHFEQRNIERERRHREEAILVGETRRLLHRTEEVDRGLMRNLNAFRCSGRTGGVNDICQCVRIQPCRLRRFRAPFDRIEIECFPISLRKRISNTRRMQKSFRRSVFQHHGETLRRELRIQRDVGSSRFHGSK